MATEQERKVPLSESVYLQSRVRDAIKDL